MQASILNSFKSLTHSPTHSIIVTKEIFSPSLVNLTLESCNLIYHWMRSLLWCRLLDTTQLARALFAVNFSEKKKEKNEKSWRRRTEDKLRWWKFFSLSSQTTKIFLSLNDDDAFQKNLTSIQQRGKSKSSRVYCSMSRLLWTALVVACYLPQLSADVEWDSPDKRRIIWNMSNARSTLFSYIYILWAASAQIKSV